MNVSIYMRMWKHKRIFGSAQTQDLSIQKDHRLQGLTPSEIHFIRFYGRSRWNFSIKQILSNGGHCRFGFRETRLCRNTRGTNSIRVIVKGERSNSPIDEGWWFRRLQHDAGQIDVAPAFDVELRIAVDLCLRDCTRGQNKVKVVFGRRAHGSSSKAPTKKYDRNFV